MTLIKMAPFHNLMAKLLRGSKIDKLSAQKVFVQMWLLSSGLAVQLVTNNMNVSENDIDLLLNDFYERLRKSYVTKQN